MHVDWCVYHPCIESGPKVATNCFKGAGKCLMSQSWKLVAEMLARKVTAKVAVTAASRLLKLL